MAFIAKNPIIAPETNLPPNPPNNTRGIFPKDDGWYDIDDGGNVNKLSTQKDLESKVDKDVVERIKYYGDPDIEPTDVGMHYNVDVWNRLIPDVVAGGNEVETKVVIPYSNEYSLVEILGVGLFSGWKSLTTVIIPNSITTIEGFVFFNCSSLTSVNIPDSVTSIGSGAFQGCSSLETIKIPSSVIDIGSNSDFDDGIDRVTIPSTITICCEQGSAAESYAKSNGNPIIYTDISKTTLDSKVDKVTGKGLSSNDYTDEEKKTLGSLSSDVDYLIFNAEHTSNKTQIINDESLDIEYPSAKAVYNELADKEKKITEISKTMTEMVKVVDSQGQDINHLFNDVEYRGNKTLVIDSSCNDSEYPSAKAVYNELIKKVDKVDGKGLSTNDYTTADKDKLDGLPTSAESTENKVTAITSSGTDEQYPSAKAVYDELGKKANTNDLGLQFVNLGYFSNLDDFDRLNIADNCYGCFSVRSDLWSTAVSNALVSGDFKQGHTGLIVTDPTSGNVTVFFVVRQGNRITKSGTETETTSYQTFYLGAVYKRTITEVVTETGGTIYVDW